MPDVNNNTQVVTEPENVVLVGNDVQGQQDDIVLGQDADIQNPIPYDRFKEVNEKKNVLEKRVQELEDQIRLSQVNRPVQGSPEVASQPKTVFDELGLLDDELITVGQLRTLQAKTLEQARSIQSQQIIFDFVQSRPDFAEVVGTVDPVTGQLRMAEPLRAELENNPALKQALLQSPQGAILAYEIGSRNVAYRAKKAAANPADQKTTDVQTAIRNASRPMSISGIGGGNLDKSAALKVMSDDEFRIYKEGIKKGEI